MTNNINYTQYDEQELINMINEERRKIFEGLNNIPNLDATMSQYHIPALSQVFRGICMSRVPSLEEYCETANININQTDILPKLKLELKSLKKEFENVVEHEKTVLKDIEMMNEAMVEMETVMADATTVDSITAENIGQIEANIKRRFEKEKSVLKEVLNCMFPQDESLRDLIATLVNNYLKDGPDAYLTLGGEEEEVERAATLVKSRLFEFHPDDPLKIRMSDIV